MSDPTDTQSISKKTFWALLDEYTIEIPIIQRDYAQGRNDEKINPIRESFVEDLYNMVENKDKTIDLDLVYGSVKNKNLVLLDGQQRITTLFLLHCYLAGKANVLDANREKLEKFTYETRISSRDFCKALVEKLQQVMADWDKAPKTYSCLSDAIKDCAWFFFNWESDPTVQSMLVMLDELHCVFEKFVQSAPSLWEKLIDEDNPPITFQFLDMWKFKLTDELYIKMNARGRPLTDFENFKAWLQGHVSMNKEFWGKIDKEWTDFFWNHREKKKDTHQIDEPYMQFFRGMMLSHYASTDESPKQEFIALMLDGNYLSTSEIEQHKKCIDEELLKNIGTTLDCLSDPNKKLESIDKCLSEITVFFDTSSQTQSKESKYEGNVSRLFVEFCKKPTYSNRVLFYVLVCFIVENNGNVDQENLQRWMRVMRNLILNTDIGDNSFANAIKSVDKLKDHCCNIYGYLSDPDNSPNISFFNQKQVEEEIRKAKLIKENPAWEAEFLKAENHEYFYGQIGFLLDFASDSEKNPDQDLFEKYAEKARNLFGPELIETKDFLLQRALLCFGCYLIIVGRQGGTLCFCESQLDVRNENWRKVFNDPTRKKYLKSLLDQLVVGEEEDSLRSIIGISSDENNCSPRNYDFSDEGIKNWSWRELFIRCHQAIAKCGQRRIYFDSYCIFLLSAKKITSCHAELHSYELFINHIEKEWGKDINAFFPFKITKYQDMIGQWDIPCAVLDKWILDGKEIVLDILYQNQAFQVELFTRGESRNAWPDGLKDKAISKDISLTKPDSNGNSVLKFKEDSKSQRGLLIENIKSEDIENVLESICTFLKQIDENLSKAPETITTTNDM